MIVLEQNDTNINLITLLLENDSQTRLKNWKANQQRRQNEYPIMTL